MSDECEIIVSPIIESYGEFYKIPQNGHIEPTISYTHEKPAILQFQLFLCDNSWCVIG